MESAKKEKLIIDYLLGELEEKNKPVVTKILENDPSMQKLFAQYRDIIVGADITYSTKFEIQEEKLAGLSRKISQDKKSGSIRFKLFKYVAAAIIFVIGVLGIYLYLHTYTSKIKEVYTEYSVPNGTKGEILLNDGTRVILNAGSKLRYSNLFGKELRKVFLEGEGFFNVVSDPVHPFIVKTRDITITVLGTKFNVRAYPEDAQMETVLLEGSVKVQKSKNSKIRGFENEIVLKPNQCISIEKRKDHAGNSIEQYKTKIQELGDADIYTSWKDPVWIIKSQRLADLAKQLERRYNVSITFKDDDLKDVKFTGKIENEPIEQVLKAIELTALVKINIKGNHVELEKSTTKN